MLVDPNDSSAELLEHRAQCEDCNHYAERALRFESRLARALRVTVPATAETVVSLAGRPAPRPLGYPKGWLAMAASVVLAVVVAGGLWLAVPKPSLASDVVTHMAEEPSAWRSTDVPVPSLALQKVLSDSKVSLAASAGTVSYANSCGFRGHQVPHLVIQTAAGPVTVMVLVHESVSQPVRFEEGGYRGVIVPVPGHGSIAVLARGSNADIKAVEGVAGRVRDSIVWAG
jgi:Protein of unknown function (DUF3379)